MPLSPWISTVAELSATWSTRVIMRRKAGLAPIICALAAEVLELLLQRPVLLDQRAALQRLADDA